MEKCEDEETQATDTDPAQPPEGLRAHPMVVEDVELVVLSYPAPSVDVLRDARLTKAEADVAELAISGLTNAEIASVRGTSVRTVANQMASILCKLGVASRRELASEYVRGALGGRHPDQMR